MTELVFWAALGANLATFLAFGMDKRQARKRRRRVPESTLLGLSWAGGLFGGWLAMSVFRHKTRKTGFKVKMVLVSIVNLLWIAIWSLLR